MGRGSGWDTSLTMWAALSHTRKGFYRERLKCRTKFAAVVFQTGARGTSPSSFPMLSFTSRQAEDKQKHTFYHSAAFWKHAVKNIQAEDTSELFVKPSSSRSGKSCWGGQPSKSQPSQPLPLDATYLPKSRAALTPRFLSCMPSGGQCAHHRPRRFRSPLPESRGQGAGWPSANPPLL